MKGTILGFDGSSGALTGEDGNRYRFTNNDWKDERPPAARDQVDFVASGETAQEIYRLKAALSMNMPEGSFIDGDKLEIVKGYAARPQFLLAIILVLSCLFLSYIEGSGDSDSISLTGVHTVYSGISTAIEQQEAVAEQFSPRGMSALEQLRSPVSPYGNDRKDGSKAFLQPFTG